VRRQGEVVQKLAHMIGTSVKLYDMVLQFLRTLFLRTRNIHYCTLRAELLMALHDLEVQVIEVWEEFMSHFASCTMFESFIFIINLINFALMKCLQRSCGCAALWIWLFLIIHLNPIVVGTNNLAQNCYCEVLTTYRNQMKRLTRIQNMVVHKYCFATVRFLFYLVLI
jgi:hypothetical protein